MKEIQRDLGLPKLPLHIELFDNSNISGADAVAACVVFEKLKPAKSEYRKFNIKTVTGPDDYASMKEVVRRRYTRLSQEGRPLPDLIIADGGRGQMEMIREVVEDELGLEIPIAGLAKDDRHRTREMLYGFPPAIIGIKPESQLFRTLTQMQDEVHRFAISFHRDKRSKRQTASELDTIAGIGPATKQTLLKQFKSVKRVKEATLPELQALLGTTRGEKNIPQSAHQRINRRNFAHMRAVIQRVQHASVTINGQIKSAIHQGFLILLGIEDADNRDDADWLCRKISALRVFDDEGGVMNRSLQDIGGEALVVSQFTLMASYKKGNRPSYIRAAGHEHAIPLYEYFCQALEQALGRPIGTGEFGADMKVELLNDGPVTICMDTKNKE